MEPPKKNIASNIYQFMAGQNIKNFPATEEEFLNKLSTDPTVRQNVYNFLSSKNIQNFPQSLDAFDQALGYGKKKESTGQPVGEVSEIPSPLSTDGSTQAQPTLPQPQQISDLTPNVPEGGRSLQPEAPDISNNEDNPFVTAGRVITDFFTNTLPASAAGAVAALTPDNPNAVTPGGGYVPTLTPEQREKDKESVQAMRTAMVEYAQEQFSESAEIRDGITDRLSEINTDDPWEFIVTTTNYIAGALAEAGSQIPLTIGTGGVSSVMQGIGGIYTQAVLEQAAAEGKTPEEIIAEGKDAPATAIAFGLVSGMLDRLGAGGVASNLSKGGLLESLRKRGLEAIARLPQSVRATGNIIGAAGGEGITEGLQTYLEGVGVNVSSGDTLLEALSKLDEEELIEAIAKGAIGGGGLSAVAQVGAAMRGTPEPITEQNPEQPQINTDAANEQMMQEAEAAQQSSGPKITNSRGRDDAGILNEINETTQEETINDTPTPTPDQPQQTTPTETSMGQDSSTPVGDSQPDGDQAETTIVRGKNEYKVKNENGLLTITDKDGKEVPQRTKQRIQNDYAKQLDYTKGRKAPEPTDIQPTEIDKYIAENSDNPSEIAEQWQSSKAQGNMEISYKDQVIGENLGKVDRDGFVKASDENNIDGSIALQWLEKGGQQIDLLAQELSETSGVEITEQDIVDFILKNRRGWKPNKSSDGQVQLEQKFAKLTGLPLNEQTATFAIDKALEAELNPYKLLTPEKLNQYNEQEFATEQEFEDFFRRELEGETNQQSTEETNNAESSQGETGTDEEVSTPPPPVSTPPPSNKSTSSEDSGAPKKKRQFIDNQLLQDPDISDEVKEGLSEDAKFYVPKKNKITAKEALAIIETKGEEESLSMFLNDSNDLTPDARVMMGEQLLLRYNQKLSQDLQTSQRNEILDKTISIADKLAKDGTKFGRAIQAYAAYSKLSPEGILRVNQKRFQTKREKELKKVREEMKQVRQVLEETTEPSAEEATKSKKVKSIINKIKKKKATTRKQVNKQGNEAIKKARAKFDEDFLNKLDKLKIDTRGAAFDATYLLTAEVYNGAIEVVKKSYQAGRTIQEAVEDAIKYIRENFKGDWDESGFRRQFNVDANKQKAINKLEQGDIEGAIKAELGDLDTTIDKLVREHYSKIKTTKRTLLDKFTNELGLDPQDAVELSQAVEQEFDRIVAERQSSILNKLYNKEKLPKKRRKKKQLIDKIVEQYNMGALKDETMSELYADYMGLPKLTPEQADKLRTLAEKVQKQPEGFQQSRAVQDLYRFQENIADKNKKWWNANLETYEALWMASILSGPSTLLVVNPAANFAESVGELFVMAVKSPRDLGVIMSGFIDGLGRGWKDAVDTFRTGYVPEKGGKIEVPMLLERTRFKGGRWNPFNYYKYVGRILTGGDILFYQANKEAKVRQLAMKRARAKNMINPSKNIWDESFREIFGSEEAMQNAREQAEKEGLKGRDLKRRVFEIIEQGREEDLRQDASDFAARATFNYDPEGTIGRIASAANLARDIPGVRFLVPFVRVVANVLDRYIDYTPFAVVRIAKGGKGFASYYKPFEGEQAIDTKIKAITGTLMMAAIGLLSQSWDDEEPMLEITADGTGDRSKNYELQEGGWQEYSVKVGGKYISYKNTPLGLVLSIIGSVRDQEKYQGIVNWDDKFALSMYAVSQFMMNQSFLKNLADFVQIFNSTGSYNSPETAVDKVSRILASPIEGVATPNAYRQTARLIMEINNIPIKRAKGLMERMVRDYPVLRDDLNNIYNSLGEPVVVEQSERLIPFGIIDEKEPSKAWRIIIENNAWVGTPRKVPVYDVATDKDRDMTDKEYTEYLKLSGLYIKQGIENQYDYLRTLSKTEVQDEVNRLKIEARRQARYELFGR